MDKLAETEEDGEECVRVCVLLVMIYRLLWSKVRASVVF